MIHACDTPPDGDFARYVERLTGGKAAAGAREDLFAPKGGSAAGTPFAASAGLPSAQAGLEPWSRNAFLSAHVKWVAGLWIATQLLARLVPGAGFLFVPALALYAAWVILNARRKATGLFSKPSGGPARRAAEAAGKLNLPNPTDRS